MSDKDYIKELFKSKLQAFETPVDPTIWTAVQGQIPAMAAKGLSVAAKVIIGLSSAAVVSTVVLIAVNSNTDKEKKPDGNNKTVELSTNDRGEIENKSNELNDHKDSWNNSQRSPSNEKDIHNERLSTQVEKQDDQAENTLISWPIRLDEERITQEDKVGIEPKSKETTVTTGKNIENTAVEQVETTNEDVVNEQPPSTTETTGLPDIQKLVLPDIFTPNGDKRNDELFVESDKLKDFSLVVLNMRNQVVYKTNDPEFRWNGEDLSGSPVPDGDYMYIVTALDTYNRPINASSRLRIVR